MHSRQTYRNSLSLLKAVFVRLFAQENGLSGMANVVLLGRTMKDCTDRLMGVNLKTLSKTFKTIIPKSKSGLVGKNIQALMLGMEY